MACYPVAQSILFCGDLNLGLLSKSLSFQKRASLGCSFSQPGVLGTPDAPEMLSVATTNSTFKEHFQRQNRKTKVSSCQGN